MGLPLLKTYPEVSASWTTLSDAAATLASESKAAKEAMADATRSWLGFRTWYREDTTEEAVWNALEFLEPHAEDWASALKDAKDAIDDFVVTGKPLQQEREDLDGLEPGLSSRRSAALTSDDEAEVEDVRTDILAFNERAEALKTDWDDAQDTFESALAAISVGTTEGLPVVAADRSPEDVSVGDGVLDWAGFTSGLDDAFGELDPKSIWRDLRGLTDEELRDWLIANPEAARALAENELPDNPIPNSAEETIKDAIEASFNGDGHQTPEGIQAIRDAWDGLDDYERELLMLLYPGIIGNLNGIPLTTRGQTNQITVAGLREQTAENLAALGPEPTIQDFLEDADLTSRAEAQGVYYDWQAALRAWKDEHGRLTTVRDGLDQAWNAYDRDEFPPTGSDQPPGYKTLFVSADNLGQIATMRGTPSADTEQVATFVPGTTTTIASVDNYNQKLDTIDGDPNPNAVSIYWAGTDFPQSLVGDNKDSTYNEQGGPLLAAFDHGADLDIPDSARTTAIGHSAGGSMLGTAERGEDGLTADNIVYVAPAGQGHEVGSPADTANPDADRYWIQTKYDSISLAQDLGGGGHGPSWYEGSDIDGDMGATRLESGYLANGEVMGEEDGFAGGHSLYFDQGSTSAQNLESVIRGGDSEVVLYHPEVEIGGHYPITTDPIEEHRDEYSAGGWDEDQVTSVRDLEE